MEKTQQVYDIPLDKVYPNPDQPRKTFDENLIKELASSIQTYGVISPIIVQRKDNGYFMIIAGERRYRAVKSLGKDTIPAIIKDYSDKTIDEIALIENLQREDLNPIDEARGYKRLMSEYGMTQEELAASVGKSRPAVANKLRLLNLSREVIYYLENGKLSEANARLLVSLPPKYQRFFASKIIKDSWSVRKTETEIKKIFKEKSSEKKDTLPLELLDLVNKMERVLHTKVTGVGDSEKGKIIIDYFTHDDLDRLVEYIEYMENSFNVKTLKVPSSVDNFYFVNSVFGDAFSFDKIIFEEGVKTIKIKSSQKEDYVIPSTAYYVDLQRVDYSHNAPMETFITQDREIVVNGGEHYYVDGNFLISKEGDLVHQYAGYESLDLQVPQNVNRVLRRSIFGLCKNIFIPENVEFFSPLFNEYSLRYNRCVLGYGNDSFSSLPILFVDSTQAAESLIRSCIQYDPLYGNYIRTNCKYMIFDQNIDWKKIASSAKGTIIDGDIEKFIKAYENLPLKIKNDVVYRQIFDNAQSAFIDEWEICSYLNREFKEILDSELYDSALMQYVDLTANSQ